MIAYGKLKLEKKSKNFYGIVKASASYSQSV
jgi:hypothetical protein